MPQSPLWKQGVVANKANKSMFKRQVDSEISKVRKEKKKILQRGTQFDLPVLPKNFAYELISHYVAYLYE